jgi:hypothetical protein
MDRVRMDVGQPFRRNALAIPVGGEAGVYNGCDAGQVCFSTQGTKNQPGDRGRFGG